MIKVILGLILAVVLFGLAFGIQTPSVYAIKTINEPSGGDCTSIGTWTSSTNTCTLSNDTNDGIVIGDNNIVLDGNGHTISGTSGNGVLVQIKQGVTVKNLNIKNFGTGINLDNTNSITLSGNTITGNNDYGISISNSNAITLSGNIITSSNQGIYGTGTNSITLTGNKISGSNNYGIALYSSNQININSNSISNSNNDGIYISGGSGNALLTGNTMSNNKGNGITLNDPGSDTVTSNTISGNGNGIFAIGSKNTISVNTITGNQYGIQIAGGSGNTLTKNTISSNTAGLFLSPTSGIVVYDNTISNNNKGITGGYTQWGSGYSGSFYNNNLINNNIQVDQASGNTFSLNPPTGGNYWSDYSTSAQGCTNSNPTSFCDKPYPFSTGTIGVVDNYPWTIQNGWHTVITTGGDMTTSVVGNSTSKAVPYTVSATQDSSPIPVNCNPASGSLFSLGTTTVVCTTSTGVKSSFGVTVKQADSISPVVIVPSNQVVTATSSSGAIVNYPIATATDNVGVTNGPTCTPSSGSMFSIGNTTVTCTASDAAGNVGKATFVVNVKSTQSQQLGPTIFPSILKTIAGQWAGGTISDSDFLQSVQYLINQGTMSVSHTSANPSSLPIPAWIKNTARMWAQGSVDDNAFASGMQYLFANGILPVQVNGVPGPISQSNAPSQSITVSTDRSSYNSGDRIYFSGTIPNTDPSSVTLLIYNPSNTFVLLASGIADSTHHFQIVVDTGVSDNLQKFSLAGTYTATAFTTDKTSGATTSFAFSPANSPVVPPPSTNTLTATTDRSSYSAGDSIIVSGTINQISSVNPEQPVVIQTYDANNELVRIDQGIPTPTGTYSVSIPAHGPMWQSTGTYTLKIQYDSPSTISTTTFYFNSGASQTQQQIQITSGGALNVGFSTNPDNPSAGGQTQMKINFLNKQAGSIQQQIDYKVSVTQGSIQILGTSITHTSEGSVLIPIQFQSGGTYAVTVEVDGVLFQPIPPQNAVFTITVSGPQNTQTTNSGTAEIDISPGAGGSSQATCVTNDNCFTPNPLRISPGTTVTWKNTDTVTHVVCSGKSSDDACGSVFEDDSLKKGQTFQFTFTNAGTFDYFCSVHPWMTGQVIVGSGISTTPHLLTNPTQQDLNNINQAKTNQTIAAEVNVGNDKTETKSIDSSVSVQTTSTTPDSLGVKVSAPDQTGPKVIVFNLNATTINVANLKDLGVEYDGKPISPAPNMDAILHAKSTDNPSFAIVVTQSGVQVMVLVPHFSTHTITLTNMSKVIPAVPEFGPLIGMIITISLIGSIVLSRRFSIV